MTTRNTRDYRACFAIDEKPTLRSQLFLENPTMSHALDVMLGSSVIRPVRFALSATQAFKQAR
jgi:hypothetical protein